MNKKRPRNLEKKCFTHDTIASNIFLPSSELCVPKNHLHHINCISSSFFSVCFVRSCPPLSPGRRCAKGSCAKKKLRATFPLYFDGTQNMKKNCVQRRMMSEYINFGVITYHKISYHGKVDRGCSSHVLFSSHSRAEPVTGGAFVVGVKKANDCRERRNS